MVGGPNTTGLECHSFFLLNNIIMLSPVCFFSEELEDIRKEIEREEEKVQVGPLKTKSEILIKVSVIFIILLN